MTTRTAAALVTLIAGLVVVTVSPRLQVGEPVRAAAQQEPSTSTLDDQVELAVTVYNSQLAMIRDVRKLRLGAGVTDVHFMDIAATVNAASVHVRSLTEPSKLGVLEQNYEYDLLDPERLLRKYVGRDVTLVKRTTTNGSTAEEAVTATLLSYNGAPVWRVNGEVVTGLSADHIRYPELPGNLYARPTLIWTLDNHGAAAHTVEAAYLAGKLSWAADYVLTVARDDRTADLDGWVTVTNSSGTAFRNARLQLVAGELNRVRERMDQAVAERAARMSMAAEAPAMAEEGLSDYHLYTLGRKTTLNNNQTKQVSLLGATGLGVTKRYVVEGQGYFYRGARVGASSREPVQVFYEFRNDAAGGLGLPLPAGTVRVYQADASGGSQFVGEDHIAHSPKDEAVTVKIGNAFDVTSERVQTDFTRIADNVYEFEYRITLRNHKSTAVRIDVSEPIGGTWRMVRSSVPWTKTSAWTAQFAVPVAADGTTELKYRVRVTY